MVLRSIVIITIKLEAKNIKKVSVCIMIISRMATKNNQILKRLLCMNQAIPIQLQFADNFVHVIK